MIGIAITKCLFFLDKGKNTQMELKNSSDWEIHIFFFHFPFSKTVLPKKGHVSIIVPVSGDYILITQHSIKISDY